jgi:hypothetical protein
VAHVKQHHSMLMPGFAQTRAAGVEPARDPPSRHTRAADRPLLFDNGTTLGSLTFRTRTECPVRYAPKHWHCPLNDFELDYINVAPDVKLRETLPRTQVRRVEEAGARRSDNER